MRPHSADLRRRIVTLYERGEGSIRQLAKRFQVSQDSVRCLIKQYRALSHADRDASEWQHRQSHPQQTGHDAKKKASRQAKSTIQ
jgi:transposase